SFKPCAASVARYSTRDFGGFRSDARWSRTAATKPCASRSRRRVKKVSGCSARTPNGTRTASGKSERLTEIQALRLGDQLLHHLTAARALLFLVRPHIVETDAAMRAYFPEWEAAGVQQLDQM